MSSYAELSSIQFLYELQSIKQSFAGKEILNIPTLRIEAGKIYGLLGKNGAGKTTLLKILAFLNQPFAGQVFFRGQALNSGNASSFRGKVVWVPQSALLFSGTVLYNVCYPMKIRGIAGKTCQEKAENFLEMVGLLHLAKASACNLSGGEAQRVSIARALATGADVLLFDEPTGNLDVGSQACLEQIIADLHKKLGLSIIITSHDGDFISALCQETIVLDNGKIVKQQASKYIVGELFENGADYGLDFADSLPSRVDFADSSLSVAGLEVVAEGVRIRLKNESGVLFDVLLNSPRSIELAHKISLGEVLQSR